MMSNNTQSTTAATIDSNNSLSQYFANDPPSFFDQLETGSVKTPSISQQTLETPLMAAVQQQQPTSSSAALTDTMAESPVMTSTTTTTATGDSNVVSNLFTKSFLGTYKPIEYIENTELLEEDMKIPDDVRCMWPPPQITPDAANPLTTPGVQLSGEMKDPIAEAVVKHLDTSELAHRKMLTVESVTQDERGLRSLIAAGSYRAAVNLTGRLLAIHGQGFGRAGQPAKHSPYSLQLWFTRLALLSKLGEYELLQIEAEPFDQLQKPDVFFEFYPEMHNGRKGSIACFSFRLLLAELPLHIGKPALALDNLSELYHTCIAIKEYYETISEPSENEDVKKLSIKFWEKRATRVMYATINCALAIKKYNLVDDLLNIVQKNLNKEELRALFSAWGRIYLQIGDIFGAQQKFAEARRLRDMNLAQDLRDLVDKGLVAVAQTNFQEAYAIFQKALHLDNCNTMVLNNMGVCLLYGGKLREAINLFERAIDLNPQRSLDESLLINLSTLYELESSNSKAKKLNLLRLINRYKPDLKMSLEVCLKLQPN